MTSARGHGAIVYCLNSGSEERQTDRHNKKEEDGERDEKKSGENGRKEKEGRRREEREAPPTQTVIEKGQWVQFHPITNLADGGPMEFLIPGSGDAYLDLSQTQLHVRAKIFKSDVDVCLNERTVSSSNNTYPYRAIIETLLNHGYDSKTSQLTSELYYKDTAGRMNVYDENYKEPNEGFKSRVKFIKGSGTVDMVGRLHVDLFNQDRLLLNLVDVKLKLIRSKPSFCLMGEGD
ncbi:uncharacterized protein F54H12.2 [Trichonephila clavipes]|nr:uncharacterized protein F54H12.2 [Trichonephila clavipes]